MKKSVPLLWPSGVLLGLTVLHDLDHVRQGRALGSELWGVGTVALISTAMVFVLAARGSSWSKLAGLVVGFGTIIGVGAVHVAPSWWFLSDSYGEAGVDAFSWAVIIAMMLVGAWLIATALSPARANRFANGGDGLIRTNSDGRSDRKRLTCGNASSRMNSEHSEPADSGS